MECEIGWTVLGKGEKLTDPKRDFQPGWRSKVDDVVLIRDK